jgi:PKD repeat protein
MVISNSQLVVFEATVTSPITDTTGLTYRWDFGDGSAFVGPFSTSQASHSYTYCGVYTVRVEVTDSYGNRTIGEMEVNVNTACSTRLLLPLLRR